MRVFIAKHKWYRKQKVVVFPKKNLNFVEINHFPGQSVLLKIKEMDQLIAFHSIFGSCVLGPLQKDYFFAVPWRGSFGHILTMQLRPPKPLEQAQPESSPWGTPHTTSKSC